MSLPQRLVLCLAVLTFLFAAGPDVSQAQEEGGGSDLSPRFGLGVQALVSTEDGLGMGLRGRASAPINADVSAAVDMGLTGFILGGTEDAVYLFEPQLSAVVNLPFQGGRLPYLMAGLGGHFPVGGAERSESGPVLHVGIGRVQTLMDSSLFYEINPGLLIGDESVDLLLPFRIGIIFR